MRVGLGGPVASNVTTSVKICIIHMGTMSPIGFDPIGGII